MFVTKSYYAKGLMIFGPIRESIKALAAKLSTDEKPLTKAAIIEFYQKSIVPEEQFRIGIEAEKIGVYKKTGQTVPYFGENGFLRILERLHDDLGWEITEKQNESILEMSRAGSRLTLESDGRIELTGKPHANIHDLAREFRIHQNEINEISSIFGVLWLGIGFHPFSSNEQIDLIPKTRIQISTEYLVKRGRLARNWVKRTASIQANIDYKSEADMGRKAQAMMRLAPIFTAMFANSPIAVGKKSPYRSYRGYCCLYTDKDRFGPQKELLTGTLTFEKWVDYALDVPMITILRSGEWLPIKQTTFRQFMKSGFRTHKATLQDFLLHLSFIYTDVRIKQYLELRTCDSLPPSLVPSLPALVKGLMYNEKSLSAIEEMTKDWKYEEVRSLLRGVVKDGLQVSFRKQKVLDIAKTLMNLASESLKAKAVLDAEGRDESLYLEPLKELIFVKEKSPAAFALEKWEGEWSGEISKLVEWCAY